jgi:hypothetical protein
MTNAHEKKNIGKGELKLNEKGSRTTGKARREFPARNV